MATRRYIYWLLPRAQSTGHLKRAGTLSHLHAPHLHIPGHHHHETAKEKKARLRAETLAKMRMGAQQHHNLEEHHNLNIRQWHRAFAHVAGERADAHVVRAPPKALAPGLRS